MINSYFKNLISESPLGRIDQYSKPIWPFVIAQVAVRVFYFFLLYSAVLLFFQWDTSIGPQTGISFIWPIAWLRLVSFPAGLAIIKIAFILTSLIASFIPQSRLVRILSFITLFEFVSLYFSVLKLDVDWYVMILVGFLLIFLPGGWSNPVDFDEVGRKKFLLVFWGMQAITLLTYSMAGIGKIYGAIIQAMAGNSNYFEPKAGALHIADRLIVTNTTSPLGPLAVSNYLLLWPFFVGSLYMLLFAFFIAFKPTLHRLWAFGLITFHIVNYLVINIGFNAHDFLLSILLILSPFAPAKVNFREVFVTLPIIDFLTIFSRKKNFKILSYKIILILFFSLLLGITFAFFSSKNPKERITQLNPSSVKIESGGMTREYFLHVPKNQGAKKLPVVIVLHGGGGPLGTAELMMQRSGWVAKSDKEGFLVVFPEGVIEDQKRPLNLTNNLTSRDRNIRTWSDGSEVTDASKRKIDDVAFINSVLNDLSGRLKVDQNKVYVTGFSNGATMSFMLGVKLADRIAAIAPVAGLLYEHDVIENTVSLLTIVGGADHPPQNKSSAFVEMAYAADYVTNPINAWRKYLGCPENATLTVNRNGILITDYGPCKNGTDIQTYRVEGMGHVYPGRADLFSGDSSIGNKISAVDISWDFFLKHPKRQN